jgi:hypothetical protein
VATSDDSYRVRQAEPKGNHPENELTNPRGGDSYLATGEDHNLAAGIFDQPPIIFADQDGKLDG